MDIVALCHLCGAVSTSLEFANLALKNEPVRTRVARAAVPGQDVILGFNRRPVVSTSHRECGLCPVGRGRGRGRDDR